MPQGCKLCGTKRGHSGLTQAGWSRAYNRQFFISRNREKAWYYHKTYSELFGGKWNSALNLFCHKHIHAIICDAVYVKEFQYKCSLEPIPVDSIHDHDIPPTDDEINRFLLRYLMRVTKRKQTGKPVIICQHPDCLKWASKKLAGVWICGNHACKHTEESIHRAYWWNEKTQATKSKNAVASLLNQWKSEIQK